MAGIENLTKEQLREKAETLCLGYNEKLQGGNFEEAMKIDEEMVQTVNEYTAKARRECFDALAATENPMLEAIKLLAYPTIRIKDTKQGEQKIPVRTIEDIERSIDLYKLHKHVEGGIGVDKNWVYLVEKLNCLLTAKVAMDIGACKDPSVIIDSYAMSDIARGIKMGETPTSNTQILKLINIVVKAMLGEDYKAISKDAKYLMYCYTRKTRKALTVTAANHRYLRQYMAEVCHRIVLDKVYDVDYKKIVSK